VRILGVDFGLKRIGLAIAESEFKVVTPRAPMAASGTLKRDAEAITAFARKEGADLVVVGLPVEEDGAVGKMARICQSIADHIKSAGLNVDTIDERYSSVEAESLLREEKDLRASQRRKLRDGEAAGILLERYLEGHEEA
jgi:putative holliday junction resolvase